MATVVIIGAGQLGSRHLQALVKSELVSNIFVIDPSKDALTIARNRGDEVPKGNGLLKITYSDNINVLPAKIDFAVIATSATVRLTVVQSLLATTKTRYLLLEKVLFQNLEEYSKAALLFKEHGVTVWVNCPRRMFDFYSELKKRLVTHEHIHLSYSGQNWGLACNSIHFIDLASYLSGNLHWKVSTEFVTQVIESKRPGYFDMLGTLFLEGNDGSTVRLTSDSESTQNGVLTIIGETFAVIVDEAKCFAAISRPNSPWKMVSFALKYQSELTGIVFEEIIEHGTCNLTPFIESSTIHEPFITALTEVFKKHELKGCPIT